MVVVLAAGKGTRMRTEEPKVLVLLRGKPLLLHVLDNVYASGCHKCIIVVGYGQEKVRSLLDSEKARFTVGSKNMELAFAVQERQLGTAHAVSVTANVLQNYEGSFIVVAGDVPLLSATSLQALLAYHRSNANAITVLSTLLKDPRGYGRVIRDEQGVLRKIVEEKDANEQERKIKEINTGSYVFEAPNAFSLLARIDSENAQREYYLPDAVELASQSGLRVDASLLANSMEGRGINSLQELDDLETYLYNTQEKVEQGILAK